MIYLNKTLFKPYVLFISIFIVPIIIMLIVSCILLNKISIYVILCCFIFIYIFVILISKKESNIKKYYLKVNEDSLEILYPNITKNEEILTINFDNIEKIEYYKMNSIKALFFSFISRTVLQKAMIITYYENNEKKENLIGYAELANIKEICKEMQN